MRALSRSANSPGYPLTSGTAELREAITLREVDGLSYEDIAERMQCPIGTVRSRIFRAREAIDQELRPLLDTEPKRERASR